MRAVIFDMDGVLIDSEPMHDIASKRAFEFLGLGNGGMLQSHLEKCRGRTETDFWQRMCADLKIDIPVAEMVKAKTKCYLECLSTMPIKPIAGVVDAIHRLSDHPLALASSSSAVIVETTLKCLQLDGVFRTIVSGNEVQNGKPAPDIFLLAAERLNIKPADCVVIEDSENGVAAALAAGMKCVAFTGTPGHNQNVSRAHRQINSFAELTPALLKSMA